MTDPQENSLQDLKARVDEIKEKSLTAKDEIQMKNKDKFDDFKKVLQSELDSDKKIIFQRVQYHIGQFKVNSQLLISYMEAVDKYVQALEKEYAQLQNKVSADQQVTKNDPSQENINNPDQQNKPTQMDQSMKGSQKNQPNDGGEDQGQNQNNMNNSKRVMNNNQMNNQADEKDRIIQELTMQLEQKNSDLIKASELIQKASSLEAQVNYLYNENEVKKQLLDQRMDLQRISQEDFNRYKEENITLRGENRYFCEQYELLKQKCDQQDITLEYLVAENSRLIIKSFAANDRKYKI